MALIFVRRLFLQNIRKCIVLLRMRQRRCLFFEIIVIVHQRALPNWVELGLFQHVLSILNLSRVLGEGRLLGEHADLPGKLFIVFLNTRLLLRGFRNEIVGFWNLVKWFCWFVVNIEFSFRLRIQLGMSDRLLRTAVQVWSSSSFLVLGRVYCVDCRKWKRVWFLNSARNALMPFSNWIRDMIRTILIRFRRLLLHWAHQVLFLNNPWLVRGNWLAVVYLKLRNRALIL